MSVSTPASTAKTQVCTGLTFEDDTVLEFSVKTCNDADLLLSSGDTANGEHTRKIVIGGWGNTWSEINGGAGTADIKHSPVSCDEFRDFYVSWKGGVIQAGTVQEQPGSPTGRQRVPFVTCPHPNMFAVKTVYVYGLDKPGDWQIVAKKATPSAPSDAAVTETTCKEDLSVYTGPAVRVCRQPKALPEGTVLKFNVRACNDAQITLSAGTSASGPQTHEIGIGAAGNTETRLFKSGVKVAYVKHIPLSCDAFRRFYVTWTRGLLEVGTIVNVAGSPDKLTPFLTYPDAMDFHAGLEKNYCRNPDRTPMPWCYVTPQCGRDFCDVCNIERTYDRSAALCKQEGACCGSRDDVITNCASTCNIEPPAAPDIDVTCGPPEPLPDAHVKGALNTSYVQGEQVTYTCNTGIETLTRTCTTSGRWSEAGYVCGGCPTGWSYFEGSCYKYFNERVSFFEARYKCRAENAVLVTPKTQAENNFVSYLRQDYMPLYLYLGLSNIETGTWVWEDGTNLTGWNNWAKNEPRGGSSCTTMDAQSSASVWVTGSCSWEGRYMCELKLSERKVCTDRLSDCDETLVQVPEMCHKYPSFANQQCPYTCGLCDASSTPACPVTTPPGVILLSPVTTPPGVILLSPVTTPPGVILLSPVTTPPGVILLSPVTTPPGVILLSPVSQATVTRGAAVTYKCPAGQVLSQGSLVKACANNGALVGTDPVCKSPDAGCGKPPTVKLAAVSYDSTQVGAKAYYECAASYHYVYGSKQIVCQNDMNWSHPQIICDNYPSFMQPEAIAKPDTR